MDTRVSTKPCHNKDCPSKKHKERTFRFKWVTTKGRDSLYNYCIDCETEELEKAAIKSTLDTFSRNNQEWLLKKF